MCSYIPLCVYYIYTRDCPLNSSWTESRNVFFNVLAFFSAPASHRPPLIGHITKYNNALYCRGRTYAQVYAFKRRSIRLNHTCRYIHTWYNVYIGVLVHFRAWVRACVCVWGGWLVVWGTSLFAGGIFHNSRIHNIMPCKCAIYFVFHQSRKTDQYFSVDIKIFKRFELKLKQIALDRQLPLVCMGTLYTCFIKLFP